MKKTILAVVTTSLLAASANAATVYDKDGQSVDVTGRIQYDAGQLDQDQDFGGEGSARLGLAGKWATASDVTLIGKLEWQVSAESDAADKGDSKFDARYAYVGADFGNGVQAIVGQADTPYTQLNDTTDIFNMWGATAEYAEWNSRISDIAVVSYAADGWDLRAGYSANDEAKVNADDAQKDYFALSSGYTFADTGLKVVYAYQQKDVDNGSVTDQVSQYGLGLGYTYDAFYVGTNFQQYIDADKNKTNIWEVAGTYKVQPDWTLLAGYAVADKHNYGETTVDEYTLGVQYDITAKAKAYAEYKIDDIATQDDLYAVGLQYNF